MKKLFTSILLLSFFSCIAQYRELSGFDPTTGRPGYKYRDTMLSLPYTTLKYVTGYGTFGSLLDSVPGRVPVGGASGYVLTKNSGTDYDYSWVAASSGSAGWGLTGNSVTAGSQFIGSTNNVSFRMRTNGIEGAVLDSNQRFGIGVNEPTSKFHLRQNSIGVTNSLGNSVMYENATAATTGAPQYSPRILFGGQGFNTTSALSYTSLWAIQGITASGTGGLAEPTYLGISNSLGGAAFGSPAYKFYNTGTFDVTGSIRQISVGNANYFASNIYLNGASNQRALVFNGTLFASINQDNTTSDLNVKVNNNSTTALTIAQNSGAILVNTTTDNKDAILNLSSVNKGALFPRMTTTQRDSMNLTITSVTVVDGGTGYVTGPGLTVTPNPGYGGTQAGNFTINRSGGIITSVTGPLTTGSYNVTPVLTVTGGGGSGAIITPVMTQSLTEGLIIYNLTTHKMQCWNGTTWSDLF